MLKDRCIYLTKSNIYEYIDYFKDYAIKWHCPLSEDKIITLFVNCLTNSYFTHLIVPDPSKKPYTYVLSTSLHGSYGSFNVDLKCFEWLMGQFEKKYPRWEKKRIEDLCWSLIKNEEVEEEIVPDVRLYKCLKCNGTGINREYVHLYLHLRNNQTRHKFNRRSYIKCKYCEGVGKIDWIDNATQKDYKVGLSYHSATSHLNDIINSACVYDNYPFFLKMKELYFKLYNLYIKDKVIDPNTNQWVKHQIGNHPMFFEQFEIHYKEKSIETET